MRLTISLALACMTTTLQAQRVIPDTARDSTRRLDVVTVSVARNEARLVRVPWAVGVQTAGDIRRGQATVGIDEALNNVPGVMVSNRYIFALDQRLSIRGAGSRANFGTRGVKVLLDGVPQSLPDGQSQLTNVELGTIGRVEVLRGAASSLYGNGSGGVISFETDMRAPDRLQQEVRVTQGSFGLAKYQVRTVGRTDRVIGSLSLSQMDVDGFRQYSEARVRQLNAAADVSTGVASTLQIRAHVADVPRALNPGALTRAEWNANADSAARNNVLRGASRTVQQQQYSLRWRTPDYHGYGVGAVAYYFARDVDNPLAAPPDGGGGPDNGTIIRIGRGVMGARLDLQREFGSWRNPPRVQFGVDLQQSRDRRREFRSTGGVVVAATDTMLVNQVERISAVGPFAVLSWAPSERWQTSAGVRWDRQSFEIDDEFTADGADDSGTRTMSALSGHFGVVYASSPSFAPYANVANAFETPTAAELNARPDGAGGFHPDLGPQRIRTLEAGARGAAGRLAYDLSAFASRTTDAIVQYEQDEGRAYFRNAGSTRSTGLELGVNVAATSWLAAQVAYTHAHYEFDRYRLTGPESVDTLDGNRLPGVPAQFVRAGIRTRYQGASLDVDWTWSDALWADDANTLRIEDWGRGRADVRIAWSGRVGGHFVSPFVGVNNVFDERYVGAITLNGLFGRVREGAPLRNWYAGLDVNWRVLR